MSYDEPRAVYFFLPFSLFFQSFSFLFFFFSVLQVLAPVIILHALRSLRKEDSNKKSGNYFTREFQPVIAFVNYGGAFKDILENFRPVSKTILDWPPVPS